jgi:hypothetical protein
MTESDRIQTARACYEAYATGDRALIERTFSSGFRFSSPDDPLLDRAGFFERCWPGAGRIAHFDIVRIAAHGDDVIVTYEATRADGTRFRNTEVLGFSGDQVVRCEVYYGWNLA